MLLPKRIIKQFVSRDRDDLRQYKRFTTEELESACNELPVRPPIWNKLRKHQKVGFLLGAKYGRIALFYDTGTGKTITSVAIARYLRKRSNLRHGLVLVPNKVNVTEWGLEIDQHSPSTEYKLLEGSTEEKWEALQANGASTLLTVTTYAGLMHMVCKWVPRKKNKTKMRMVPDMKLVKQLCQHVDGLFMDESTVVGKHRKLPFRICRQIAKRSRVCIALSGTPFGRDPSLLWSQMFLIDWGASLGENLTLFRGALFKETENYWSGFPDYVFDKSKKKLLTRLLAHRSLRYKADEADLPKVIQIRKVVRLPQETSEYYKQAKAKLVSAIRRQEKENMFIRLRQLSSGFLGYKDDAGQKAQFKFDHNPKLEMLTSILESIRDQHKAIVFHDFIASGQMICGALKELKIGHVWIRGGAKDVGKLRAQFDNDPNIGVMVVNTAGAFGLNLQKAKYGIFYESPVSVILRKQMEARFIRQYSKHAKVFLYDLVTERTVDEQILAFHREGKDLFKAIVDGDVGVA